MGVFRTGCDKIAIFSLNIKLKKEQPAGCSFLLFTNYRISIENIFLFYKDNQTSVVLYNELPVVIYSKRLKYSFR